MNFTLAMPRFLNWLFLIRFLYFISPVPRVSNLFQLSERCRLDFPHNICEEYLLSASVCVVVCVWYGVCGLCGVCGVMCVFVCGVCVCVGCVFLLCVCV